MAFNTKDWTPREHFEWRLANLKGAIELSTLSIRSLILVNGAAAAGLLTFYGTLLANNPSMVLEPARAQLAFALACFGTGVGSATLCAILAYFAQRATAVTDTAKLETIFTVLAVVLAILSAGSFFLGLHAASTGLM